MRNILDPVSQWIGTPPLALSSNTNKRPVAIDDARVSAGGATRTVESVDRVNVGTVAFTMCAGAEHACALLGK